MELGERKMELEERKMELGENQDKSVCVKARRGKQEVDRHDPRSFLFLSYISCLGLQYLLIFFFAPSHFFHFQTVSSSSKSGSKW